MLLTVGSFRGFRQYTFVLYKKDEAVAQQKDLPVVQQPLSSNFIFMFP